MNVLSVASSSTLGFVAPADDDFVDDVVFLGLLEEAVLSTEGSVTAGA